LNASRHAGRFSLLDGSAKDDKAGPVHKAADPSLNVVGRNAKLPQYVTHFFAHLMD
jgi:hypothetical protein